MSAKVWLGGMVAASALVIATGSRSEPATQLPARHAPAEAPWLTPQAAAEIIGPDGRMGPLFEGVDVGGLAPSPTVRARIAEFARANNVKIDLEIHDGEVAAVRFDVTYGGCCGYEGADVLARRIGRPRTSSCCGCEESWLDDWAIAGEDGVHVRARVRVNRLVVRWEHVVTFDELVERADRLVGADRAAVAKHARDHWIELEPSRRYLLEIPYRFTRGELQYPDDLGMQLVAAKGRIVEVSFSVRNDDEEGAATTGEALRARWGRPRVLDDVWTWQKPDRTVTAELDSSMTRVTVSMR